jgi:hypothetical protein
VAGDLLLRLFADLDEVPLRIANFEKLRIAAVLNRPSEHAAPVELLMPFL